MPYATPFAITAGSHAGGCDDPMLSALWRTLQLNRTPGRTLSLGAGLSCYFGAVFLAYGVVVPYFPVWLQARGLSPVEISTVTAVPLFLRVLFTPSVLMIESSNKRSRSAKASSSDWVRSMRC